MFVHTSVEFSSSPSESRQLCRQFTFSEIQLATRNFDESLVIGRGGFGKVYKGNITNGANLLTVAIKRLDSTSSQGASEFWAEVNILSNLRHCHLVSLIGYCSDEQELILVYEYMSHGTLEDHLHRRHTPLSWVQRLTICIGAARGLDYLHTGTGIKHGVVHRDIKSSNILLHNSWAAKISDFGLSKICPRNQQSTYVNTIVKGTFGYLDPDYFYTGKLTRKSDVYAFGVVLFEVLCGKRAVDSSIDEEHWGLAIWAQESIKEGRLKQIVDANLRAVISTTCLKGYAQLAKQCLHMHPKQRPTMAEVVVGLESVLALQEKANNTLQPTGIQFLAKKALKVIFPSGDENSDFPNSKAFLMVKGGKKIVQNPNEECTFEEVREKLVTTLPSKSHLSNRVTLQANRLFQEQGGQTQTLHQFDFDTISVATENFSEANIIPQLKTYDSLYKGKLHNGQGIAVSRIYYSFGYECFMNEVSIIVELEHENLAKLLGYCIEETGVIFLVYEYELHATLDRLMFDPGCTILNWDKRYKIILGVARALLYLHRDAPTQMMHCNVKPGNILLDDNINPMLSGFLNTINKTEYFEPWRYVAPEYILLANVSTKADVYSLGVLVLETLTGTPEFMHPIKYVKRKWMEGTLSNIIDPRIDVDLSSMTRFFEIGLLCVQKVAKDRPTMEEVVGMLLGSLSHSLPVSKMRARVRGECSNSNGAPVSIRCMPQYKCSSCNWHSFSIAC